MKNAKNVLISVVSVLSSWLGLLFVPMMLLVACNIIDYGTGLCAAKYRDETIKSYKSIRGITKKVCMWLLVAVGAMLDRLIIYAAEYAGLVLPLQFLVASVVAVWLIANEMISIFENMKDIGVPMPSFLEKLAANIKGQSEKAMDIEEGNDDEN